MITTEGIVWTHLQLLRNPIEFLNKDVVTGLQKEFQINANQKEITEGLPKYLVKALKR